MPLYDAGIWPGNGHDRSRWAVCGPTGCWTFPTNYGERAARRLAAQMTRAAAADDQTRRLNP